MAKRVTIQDIADELHLSRNTISKAINNTGNVSPETKNLIFRKAAEMGYKQFPILGRTQFSNGFFNQRDCLIHKVCT